MNVKRFLARTSREALALVRQSFGDDAVVLSTKPAAEGVEVLAMAPESVQQIERLSASTAGALAKSDPSGTPAPSRPPRTEPGAPADVESDVEQLSMSTLSFQDYVRERMLKRRQAELTGARPAGEPEAAPRAAPAQPAPTRPAVSVPAAAPIPVHAQPTHAQPAHSAAAQPAAASVLREALDASMPSLDGRSQREQQAMLAELRAMKGLIEDRFGALAFMEKLQRQPGQARLTQRLLEAGFSPALTRRLVEGLPQDAGDETAWAASVLERNLMTGEAEPALEDQGGVYALIGATGVGKTTSTAKIAAAFATTHGAGALGLITLDAYRVAAHEQLRAYGRILGVPVHTAHDRASLEDLLDLLSGKRMVLIDTAGMGQRDARTRELLDMVSHRAIHKLLVVNAAAQGETIDDVMVSYRAAACRGAVLSKIDEAVKLGPALDALIRHKLPVLGVANGQRVPEDWHRLSSHALVQRALRERGAAPWHYDSGDVSLVFAGATRRAAMQPGAAP